MKVRMWLCERLGGHDLEPIKRRDGAVQWHWCSRCGYAELD